MRRMNHFFQAIGHRMINGIWHLGAGGRLFFYVALYLLESIKRPRLIIKEVFATGVLSLLIVIVSAFFS